MMTIVGWALVVVTGGSISLVSLDSWAEARPPDPAVIWPLLVALLVAAALVQMGPTVSRRLKKVGPIEFFAAEAREAIPELEEILNALRQNDAVGFEVTDAPPKLDPEERYNFEKADRLVDHLRWSGADVGSDPSLQKLVSTVAMIALDQHQRARAVDRLRLLSKATDGQYKPEVTWHKLALAEFLLSTQFKGGHLPLERARKPGFGSEDARRRELLRSALDSAEQAIRAVRKTGDPGDFRPHFTRAQVLHFLGDARSALRAYEASLDLEPAYAPAKFNRAALLAKEGRLDEAWRQLVSLHEDDLGIDKTLEGLSQDPPDPELSGLYEDSYYGRLVRDLRSRLEARRRAIRSRDRPDQR